MKKFLLCLVILILLIPAMPITAQEPGTPEDNACNPGGAMYRENPADGCNSEWHWVCGYYMARFYTRSYNVGGYDTSLVPDWCASLLPPRPAVPASTTLPSTDTSICYFSFVCGGCSILYSGVPNRTNNASYFDDNPVCTGNSTLVTVVVAANIVDASQICGNLFPLDFGLAEPLTARGYNTPSNLFACIVGAP